MIGYRIFSNIFYNYISNDVEFISLANNKEILLKTNGKLELIKIKDIKFLKFIKITRSVGKSLEKSETIAILFKSKYKLTRYRVFINQFKVINSEKADKIKPSKENMNKNKNSLLFSNMNDSLNRQNSSMIDINLLLYLLREDVEEFEF